MTHTLHLQGHTARLNELMHCHWRTKHALKKRDREYVMCEALAQRIPEALGKRRVKLTVVLEPRQRAADGDAWWKSLLDSMVAAHVLKDDSPRWCELLPVVYERGARLAMRVELEDV